MQKNWRIAFTHSENIRDPVEHALKLRGVADPHTYLSPPASSEYPPNRLKNMPKAVAATRKALAENSPVAVLFDVDVDGCCAGAIVTRYLKELGATVYPLINQGKRHGLAGQSLDTLTAFPLVIACDSLSNEHPLYDQLEDAGVSLILLDHHAAAETPTAALLVNSEMHGYPNPQLSGSGVALKFVEAMDEALTRSTAGDYADLAAAGIVADVMDLSVMENRSICRRGFSTLRNKALRFIIGGYPYNAQAVSYSIAPLINALCRQGENHLAVELLLCDDDRQLRRLIRRAKEIKAQQDELVARSMADLLLQFEHSDLPARKVLIGTVPDGGGVAGLCAAKLSSAYCRPAIVLHQPDDQPAFLHGSIRSFGPYNFRALINKTGLAEAKGHDNAAGIFLPRENLAPLSEALEAALAGHEFIVERTVDFETKPALLTPQLIRRITEANHISGHGAPPITCVLRSLVPASAGALSGKHTKFICSGLEFLYWNDTQLLAELERPDFSYVDIVGTPGLNTFAGRSTRQFIVSDYITHTGLAFEL